MTAAAPGILLVPDAGPLITLAYAEALDLLLKPGWNVKIVDIVMHELTRNLTPTSTAIATWVGTHGLTLVPTRTLLQYQQVHAGATPPRKTHLGELAAQEAMQDMARSDPATDGIFLFEEHRLARSSFRLPANFQKLSTLGFLRLLEQQGWIPSAHEVERLARLNGRNFSPLRFPFP